MKDLFLFKDFKKVWKEFCSTSETMFRRERLRKLALETIDLSKACDTLSEMFSSEDPYFMRNHLGSYECRLCLTLHSNEGAL